MKNKLFIPYLLALLALTLLLSFLPGHNGDLAYYISCVIEKEQGNSIDVLQKTKEVLERELSPQEFAIHAKRLAEAPANILDFYRIKPLYIFMVRGFHAIGFSYILSTLIPSLLAYFFLGLLCFSWAGRVLSPIKAFVISILMMIIYPVATLARLSSPDGLSNLVIFAALYLFYFEKNQYVIIALLFLSIWIRMDNALAAVLILTGLRFRPLNRAGSRLGGGIYFILLLALIGMTMVMNGMLEKDFWWFKQVTYSSSLQYGRQLLLAFLSISHSFLMGLIVFFVLIQFSIKFRITEKDGFLLLVILGIFVTRLLLFPSFEERFAAAYYICVLLMFAEKMNGLYPGLKSGKGQINPA